VLVKTLPSVEALGNVDVICTDKTGTLTEGRFSLIELIPFGDLSELERNRIAIFACERSPVDSIELAIYEKLNEAESLKQDWSVLYDYPFEGQGKHMTHVWRDSAGETILAMKGSAEGVLEHCQIEKNEKDLVIKTVEKLSGEGK
jgi:magnesium-transporting ATPase (P-type)